MTTIAIIIIIICVCPLLFIAYYYNAKPTKTFNYISEFSKKASNFTRESIVLNGKTYYYLDNHKKNVPIAIYLHGFTDRKEAWFPYMMIDSKKYLFFKDDNFRIILPDLPGHGENEIDTSISYTFKYYSDFLHQFKQALHIDKFHLLGVSMGGAIAGKYSYSHQKSLLSLTMMSNAGINSNTILSKMEKLMLDMSYEEKKENIPMIPKDMSKKSIALLKKFLVYDKMFVPHKMFVEFARHIVENREFYIKIIEDFLDTETGKFKDPLDPHLKDITIPTLIIWGKEDAILHYSSVEVIRKIMTNKPEIHLISKCGHGAYVEYPYKVKSIIRTFLAKHS